MSDAADLAAGFRRLRPVVRDWLARDLAGPPLEYTRAYADLMFAYAFARLGAADDAAGLVRAAAEPLATSADEAHVYLARMFRYRIDEALAGRPNSGHFPEDVALPPDRFQGNDPRRVQIYTARALLSDSLILDPLGATDLYAVWSAGNDPVTRRVEELRRVRDPDRIAETARAVLDTTAGLDPAERARAWAMVLPCAARAGHDFTSRLLMEVPDVVHRAAEFRTDRHDQLRGLRLLAAFALDRAAVMPDGEFFPPLMDAAVAAVRGAPDPGARMRCLAEVGWAALRWFRRLGDEDEAGAFLYDTREFWPAPDAWGPAGRLDDTQESCLPAAAAGAALEKFVRRAGADIWLAAAADVLTTARVSPKGTADGFVGVVTALGQWPPGEAVDRAIDLLGRVGRVTNTFTTAGYYSRLHLRMAEAVPMAFPAVRGA